MPKLVATLGTSPGGVAESLLYLNKIGILINDIEILLTSEPTVLKSYNIVSTILTCCVNLGYDIYISKHVLPFNDIESNEELITLKTKLEEIINEGDYVDITGGRKAISVIAALIAKKKKAHVITSIIPQDEYTRINNLLKNIQTKEIKSRRECDEETKKLYCSLISNTSKTILFEL
jgi:CRISPR-associated protein Csx14